MKKFFNAILVMMISIFLISCGEKDNPPVVTPPDTDPSTTTTSPEKDYKTFLDSINVASPNYEMVIEITDPEGKIILTNKFDGKKVSSSTNLEEQPEPTYWETVNNKIYSYRFENSKWIREESSEIDIVNPIKEDYFKSENFTYKDGKFSSTKESVELSIKSVVIEVTDDCKGAIFDMVVYTGSKKINEPTAESTKNEGQVKITVKNNGTTSVTIPTEYITKNDLEQFLDNIKSEDASYEMVINSTSIFPNYPTIKSTTNRKVEGNKISQTVNQKMEYYEKEGDILYEYDKYNSIWVKEKIKIEAMYYDPFKHKEFKAENFSFEDGKFSYFIDKAESSGSIVVEVTEKNKGAKITIIEKISTESGMITTTMNITITNYGQTNVELPEEYIEEKDIGLFLANITNPNANYQMSVNYRFEGSNFSYNYHVDGNKIYQNAIINENAPTENYFEIIDDKVYVYSLNDSVWTKEENVESIMPIRIKIFTSELFTFRNGMFSHENSDPTQDFCRIEIQVTIDKKGASMTLYDWKGKTYDVIISSYGNITVTLPTVS